MDIRTDIVNKQLELLYAASQAEGADVVALTNSMAGLLNASANVSKSDVKKDAPVSVKVS